MQLIPFVYILLVPVLMIWYYVEVPSNKLFLQNVLVALNMLMLVSALYTIRIIIGLIQLVRAFSQNDNRAIPWEEFLTEPFLRTMGTILLPFLFLVPSLRKSWWASLMLAAYTIWNLTSTNTHDYITIFLEVAELISLFAVVYAVLWLFKKLPTQQNTN